MNRPQLVSPHSKQILNNAVHHLPDEGRAWGDEELSAGSVRPQRRALRVCVGNTLSPPLTVRNLWYFTCGRGNHEKTIAQLKTGLAFHSVPTQGYAGNRAWQ